MRKLKLLLYTEAPSSGGVTQVISTLIKGTPSYDKVCVVPSTIFEGGWTKDHHNLVSSFSDSTIASGDPLIGWVQVQRMIRFVRFVRQTRPDICHFHLHSPLSCFQGILLVKLSAPSKIVVTEHYLSQLRYLRNKQRGPFLSILREVYIWTNLQIKRFILRYIDHTILLSTGDYDLFGSMFGRVSSGYSVVFNGIDTERYAQGKRVDLKLPSQAKTVLTIADLNRQKGHRYLIEAVPAVLRRVEGVFFFLAGDGHLRSELESLVKQKGLKERVHFLGRRTDIPDLLASADIVVLPSLFEGLPLTLLEAMSAGKPVIATNVNGSRDVVISGETGFLVEPKDVETLANRIVELLTNERLRTSFGKEARKRAIRAFDSKICCWNNSQVYAQILGLGL
jgi:glycosyltransferase involved in cell wall biosynthesis